MDHEDALFIVDPPYAPESRKTNGEYGEHECSPEYHEALVEAMLAASGKFMLFGYDTPLYKPLEDAGWLRHEFPRRCTLLNGMPTADANRVEIIWRKPDAEQDRMAHNAAVAGLDAATPTSDLFGARPPSAADNLGALSGEDDDDEDQ